MKKIKRGVCASAGGVGRLLVAIYKDIYAYMLYMHILLSFSVYKMYIVALLLSTSHRLCKAKGMDIYFLTLAQESNTAHYHKYCLLCF